MNKIVRHALALASMCAGSSAVFAVVYVMNQSELPHADTEQVASVNFQVVRKVQPKKHKAVPKKRLSKPRVSAQQAPRPMLASSLSGISFNLPSFVNEELGEVSKDLLGNTQGPMVMTEGALDTTPRALRRVPPQFPSRARKRGVHGFVKMSVFVNQNGSVEKVRILDAAPRGVFEDAAEEAIRGWEFSPGVYEGKSVAAWITQTFRFELKKTT